MKMKKWILSMVFMTMFAGLTFGQLIDEKNVTVTMDLQPVLQLHMETADEINFVFDNIQDYMSGKTKYAATVLKVSSTVSWDLYAVGTSQIDGIHWDNPVSYYVSMSGISDIPLSALELRQYPPNGYAAAATLFPDYNEPFRHFDSIAATYNPGQNNIYYSAAPYTAPGVAEKYIQGHSGTGAADSAPGGSYLNQNAVSSNGIDAYYFTIDYRIVPGLPAIFPFAADNAGAPEALASYANPGVYTMNVKYIILEDQ